jgi:DNA-binding CsgD family transcriptional regulator
MFGLPAPGLDFYASDAVDPAAIREMAGYIADRARNAGEAPDPLINRFYERRERLGLEVFDHDLMVQVTGDGQKASPFYNEVWARHGLHRVHVLYVTTPMGVANLHVHHPRTKNPFGADALGVMRALLPSFKAGLDAVARLHGQRAALDTLSEPLAVFSADGRELHRNPALTRLLADEPERGRLEADVRHLARGLRRLAFPRRFEAPAPASPSREVATARGRYTLRGSVLPAGLFGPAEAFLVSVHAAAAPALPTADAVRARFGLTAREAEVALLIAEGLKNDAIAERLFIAPATARRHTEGVMAKLDVQSRAAVAPTLMRPA